MVATIWEGGNADLGQSYEIWSCPMSTADAAKNFIAMNGWMDTLAEKVISLNFNSKFWVASSGVKWFYIYAGDSIQRFAFALSAGIVELPTQAICFKSPPSQPNIAF